MSIHTWWERRKDRKLFNKMLDYNDMSDMRLGYKEYAVQTTMEEIYRALCEMHGTIVLGFDYQKRTMEIDVDGGIIEISFSEGEDG